MKKFLLSALVLTAFSCVSWLLVQMRPSPEAQEIKRKIPYVETLEAKKKILRSTVQAYGTVRPRTLSTLIAEVPGIIEAVAPFSHLKGNSVTFRPGGFFRKGELLLKIEDIDLRTQEAEAGANLRRAELQLIQERELAKQAKIEWGDRDWNKASDLVKRIPQILKAEAEAKAAEARLVQASQDLTRSQVKAPFEGRILKTMVDVGQHVGGGTSAALAEIYSLESAEIDLALSRSEISFLGFSDGFHANEYLKVNAEILDDKGNAIHQGILDRSEGLIDERTRLTNLVVRVDDCFANPFVDSPPSSPLTVGQFVNLLLIGKEVEVFVIPESAFRTKNQILVVDQEDRLRRQEVSVIHRRDKEVWVSEGLKEGTRICVTPIEIVAEGMKIQTTSETMKNTRTAP